MFYRKPTHILFRLFRHAAFFIISFALLSDTAFTDSTFVYEIKENIPGEQPAIHTEKILIKDQRMKILSSENQAEIINFDESRIYYINYAKHEYSTLDFEALKQNMLDAQNDLRGQFAQDSLEGADLKEMLEQRDPTNEQPLVVSETEERQDIGVYKCRKTLLKSPLRSVQAWSSAEVKGREELKSTLDLLALTQQEIPFLYEAFVAEHRLLENNQFPVQLVTEMGTSASISFRQEKLLVDSRTDPILDQEFTPPPDFTLITET